MKVSTFGKIAVSAGAVALVAGSFATPAFADPASVQAGSLVGLGSDTTQDVLNGLATVIGGGKIASYDAVFSGANTVTTRPGGVAIPRASGSGAGRDELRVAIGQTATANVATSNGSTVAVTSSAIGQIDFARSSGGPASTDVSAEGVLAYVPFARDAVDVGVDPNGQLAQVPFFLGNGTEGSTAPSLYNIYRGTVKYVYVSTTTGALTYGAAATSAGSTAYAIQPVLPKFGSGTRSYFLGQLGFSGADADASNWVAAHPTFGVKDTFTSGTTPNTPIEEHDGTAIAIASANLPVGTFAVGPFSIGQYVTQTNAVNGTADRRKGVVLPALGKTAADPRVAATTGTAPSIATNTAYAAMVRDVYNIVPSRQADDTSSSIARAFIGANSLVCQQSATITQYGFLTSPICGTAPSSLRAYAASTSTTSLTVASSTTAGTPVSATATVTSNGNAGGSVIFGYGTNQTTVPLAAGATSVTASLPAPTAGNLTVKATFVPALSGVALSTTADANVAVNAVAVTPTPTPTTPAVVVPPVVAPVVPTITVTSKAAAKVTVSKIKNVKKGKTAKITIKVTTASKKTVTGTVTVKDGKKVVVKNAKLKKGKVTVSIKKVKKGTHKLTVTYNGSTAYKVKTKTGLKLKAI